MPPDTPAPPPAPGGLRVHEVGGRAYWLADEAWEAMLAQRREHAAALARARKEALEEAARHVETLAEREEYRLLPTRARAMRDAAKECRALAAKGAAP